MRKYITKYITLITLSISACLPGCSHYVTPPDPPVPEASLRKMWINNTWQRHEVNSYSWHDGHRITKGRKAVWVDGHWATSGKKSRYVPGHWR